MINLRGFTQSIRHLKGRNDMLVLTYIENYGFDRFILRLGNNSADKCDVLIFHIFDSEKKSIMHLHYNELFEITDGNLESVYGIFKHPKFNPDEYVFVSIDKVLWKMLDYIESINRVYVSQKESYINYKSFGVEHWENTIVVKLGDVFSLDKNNTVFTDGLVRYSMIDVFKSIIDNGYDLKSHPTIYIYKGFETYEIKYSSKLNPFLAKLYSLGVKDADSE